MINRSLLAVVLFLGFTASSQGKGNSSRREALRWLDRSLEAQRHVGTADVRCSLWISGVENPTVASYSVGMEVLSRTVPDDTICGFWFSMRLTDCGTGNESRIVYNGDGLFHAPGDSVMTVFPAEDASTVPLFFTEWHERLKMLRESLVLPDSVFRKRYPEGSDIGHVAAAGDTLIDGRACRLIRNTLNDADAVSDVRFRTTEVFALDTETGLPLFRRSHFVRTQRNKKTNDQVIVQKVEAFSTERPVADSVFRSPALPVRMKIPLAGVTDSTRIRWCGGKDILGRWPERTFSDSTMRGRFVVLDFSYKSCGFCQLTLPVIDSLARVYAGDSRVQFLMVDAVDSPKTAAEYAGSKNILFPVLSVNEHFAASFGINTYPVVVILGPDGKQVFRIKGYPGSRKKLADMLGNALQKLIGR